MNSQENIDKILTSRTLHDAELIHNGAEFSAGKLEVPQYEIDRLRREDPSLTKEIGFVVLKSDAEEALDRPMESVIQDAEKRQALADDIAKAVAPFSNLFEDKLPGPEANKRNVFGKLKTNPVSFDIESKRKQIGNMDAQYDLSITYIPGELENEIAFAEMQVVDKRGLAGDYDGKVVTRMRFGYQNGRVSRIQLGAIDVRKDSFKELFEQDTEDRVGRDDEYEATAINVDGTLPMTSKIGRKILAKLRSGSDLRDKEAAEDEDTTNKFGAFLRSTTVMSDSVDIKLDDEPKIIIYYGGRPYSGKPNKEHFPTDGTVECSYSYDASRNLFRLNGNDRRSYNSNATRPDSLTVSEFTEVLSDALNMLPVVPMS